MQPAHIDSPAQLDAVARGPIEDWPGVMHGDPRCASSCAWLQALCEARDEGSLFMHPGTDQT